MIPPRDRDRSASSAPARSAPKPKRPHAVPLAQIGSAAPLPHRAEMERAFGLSLDGVDARVGAGSALDRYQANAATTGNRVAFRDAAPPPEQVAHEVTHVLQQSGGEVGGGVSSPTSPAEREADRNAARVAAGLAPLAPQARAPHGMIHRDIKQDLESAVAGWGTDEQAIYTRLQNATPDEIKAVKKDPQLMQDLYDDLSRDEWGYVLGLLGLDPATRIHAASEGWGTDEEGIFNALRATSAPDLKTLMENGTVLMEMRDELSDSDLGYALAIVADKFQRAPGITFEEAFHALMLYPDAVDDACKYFDGAMSNNVVSGVIRKLPTGSNLAAGTVADLDTEIDNDDNVLHVHAAFEQRWHFSDQAVADPGKAPPAWTVSKIRDIHHALKEVPSAHVTRPTQAVSGFQLDATKKWEDRGYWRTPFIGVGKDYNDVEGLVRHEIGHSIDDKLGATSTAFKKNATNGWDWGNSATVWQTYMPNPWLKKDGTQVPVADQAKIIATLDSYVAGDGTKDLWDFAPVGDAVRTYWSDKVPMIQAARSIAGYGESVYDHLGSVEKFGGRYFSFSIYYHYFCTYNLIAQDKRVSDYSFFGHQEFFAEMYEAYYADGPGPERGKKLKDVPNWKQFFDTVVHPTA